MVEQGAGDNTKHVETMEHASLLANLKDGGAKFFHAVAYEAVESPALAISQFVNETTGKHLPDFEITRPDNSFGSTAGSLVGNVAKYVLLSKAAHGAFKPAEAEEVSETAQAISSTIRRTAIETSTVGAAAGFLTPVENGSDYWKEKGIGMVTSAAAFGTMGSTAAAMGESTFLRSQSALTRTVAINGIAGIAGGTVESTLDATLHNRELNLKQTAATAGSYALFGAAFGGVAHAVGVYGASEIKSAKLNVASDSNGINTDAPGLTLREHASRAVQTVHEKTLRLGRSIDQSIYNINPLRGLDNFSGMQLAYEGANYSSPGEQARPFFSGRPTPLSESRMFSVAHNNPSETGFDRPLRDYEPRSPRVRRPNHGVLSNKPDQPIILDTDLRKAPAVDEPEMAAQNARAKGKTNDANLTIGDAETQTGPERKKVGEARQPETAKKAPSYDIRDVLNTSTRGSEIQHVLEQLNQEHPAFLKGLRSSSPDILAGGRDTVVIDLVDGKYKNAVLKFTTIFGDTQETLTPTQWDPEWGHRPYDAPLLSKVMEVELGNRDIGYVYVQERGDGATKVDSFYDPNDDATFAKDKDDPDLEKMMKQLEDRQEEFVDPGSRQLAWSAIKNRLVLLDYAAVMRSADIPAEWRAQISGAEGKEGSVTSRPNYSEHTDHNDANDDNDEPQSPIREIKDANVEELRYAFYTRPATTAAINVQNQIAEQIFSGESDQDIQPYIQIVCQDSLASLGKNAKEAIKWTRQILKDQHLI